VELQQGTPSCGLIFGGFAGVRSRHSLGLQAVFLFKNHCLYPFANLLLNLCLPCLPASLLPDSV